MLKSIYCWSMFLMSLAVLGSGCKYHQERVRVPVALPRDTDRVEISKEGDTPSPNSAVTLPSQTVPLPPPTPLPPPVRAKRSSASKAAKKETSSAVAEQPALPSATAPNPSSLQLAPDIPEKEKKELIFKTNQELKSAEDVLNRLLKSRKLDALSPEQRTTVSTIRDFMEKSKVAHQRGDYQQAYAMAQKANILAVSLAQY